MAWDQKAPFGGLLHWGNIHVPPALNQAMAVADIVHRAYTILYGTGLGEKPAVRLAASNANESVSGQLVTFSVASGEGAKCKPGQVLSVYDPDTEGDAHAILVTSISTDAITGVNGWLGSPDVSGSDSGDLDSAVLEQNPLVTGFELFEAVDAIFTHFLFPQIYDITTATISSPDLTDGQEAVNANALEIINAHQIIGSTAHPVGFTRFPQDVNTTIASTGKLATFDWVTSSTGYYTYKEKLAEADESSDELTRMVATGAVALCLGGHLVETTIQGTKHENAQAVSQRAQVGSLLWRDFLTMKQAYSEQLGRQGDANRILVSRG